MQFNRDASGKLNPLPKPSVDTGAGLDRIAAVLQGKISNFDTDLFHAADQARPRELCNVDLDKRRKSCQPQSDCFTAHHRGPCPRRHFSDSDGVIPSNEGRGYVLRKIIRRAVRHAHVLDAPSPFLSAMSDAVREQMRNAYPELAENAGASRSVCWTRKSARFATHSRGRTEEARRWTCRRCAT